MDWSRLMSPTTAPPRVVTRASPATSLAFLGLKGPFPGSQNVPPDVLHPVCRDHVLQQEPPVFIQTFQQRLDP